MIRLDIKEYCHDCLDFRPYIVKPERVTKLHDDGSECKSYTDTIIQCEYRNRCENLRRYLAKHLEGEDA